MTEQPHQPTTPIEATGRIQTISFDGRVVRLTPKAISRVGVGAQDVVVPLAQVSTVVMRRANLLFLGHLQVIPTTGGEVHQTSGAVKFVAQGAMDPMTVVFGRGAQADMDRVHAAIMSALGQR